MADYGKLTRILAELGEADLQVDRAVLVKFGTILLAEKKEEKSSDASDTYHPPVGTAKRIFGALTNHPNIFEPTIIFDREEGFAGRRRAFFVKGPFCHYRVHLPRAKQKYQDMESAEHFSVISNGSLFAAYMELEDVPAWSNIGHEFRELAKEQIVKETPLLCPNIGPCPIHPDIVIVVRKAARDGAAASVVRRYERDEDIFIITSAQEPILQLVLDSFFDFGFALELFYELMASRSDLIDSIVEVTNSFSEVSEGIKKLLEAPSWNLWKTHVLSRRARLGMASIHENIVALESDLLGYERERSEAITRVERDRDSSLLSDFVRDLSQPDVAIPTSLGAALSFFESELDLYGNVRSLLLASLIGAIVGAILSGLLTHPH